jgi:catechol 2,3-dioxygenase-like lactoylglutathione lyase family enzyme
MYKIHHIHLRSADPLGAAEWYVQAFGFRITSDTLLPSGERFVRCMTGDDFLINISSAKAGEALGEASSDCRLGLEHFALGSPDVEADVERLKALGVTVLQDPAVGATGRKIAFVRGPTGERLELVEIPKS